MIRPSLVIRVVHLIFPLLPLFLCHGAGPSGMIINHFFRFRDPEHASKLELSRLRRTGKLPKAHQDAHKISESQSQTRLSINEHPQHRLQTRSHIATKTFSDGQKARTTSNAGSSLCVDSCSVHSDTCRESDQRHS